MIFRRGSAERLNTTHLQVDLRSGIGQQLLGTDVPGGSGRPMRRVPAMASQREPDEHDQPLRTRRLHHTHWPFEPASSAPPPLAFNDGRLSPDDLQVALCPQSIEELLHVHFGHAEHLQDARKFVLVCEEILPRAPCRNHGVST